MELVRSYTLRLKDIPLVKFSLLCNRSLVNYTENSTYHLKINKIYSESKKWLPKSLLLQGELTERKLRNWINKRKVPQNRQFATNLLASINDGKNLMNYVDVTQALSLNDAYWITPDDMSFKWQDCNLYEHPFDERLSMVAFTGCRVLVSGVVTTPEMTTTGALKKCWIRRQGNVYLMKGDGFFPKDDGRTQATIEWYAAQIAEVMNIPHISYELDEFEHNDTKREAVSLCKLFTSADVGYLDAYTYFMCKGIDVSKMDDGDLENQVRLAKLFGYKEYADMMVFDSVICNKDRHYGNFGYLINNNTTEFIKPAPLWDNGRSLLYDASDYELHHLEAYMKGAGGQGYVLPFDTQAKLFVEERHISGLTKLTTFTFKNHPKYPLAEKTLEILSTFVRKRARNILRLYQVRENDKKSLGAAYEG